MDGTFPAPFEDPPIFVVEEVREVEHLACNWRAAPLSPIT